MLEIPEFKTKKELVDFLVANKESLIAQKCSAVKEADAMILPTFLIYDKSQIYKAANETSLEVPDELKVKAIINTTGIMDSHSDVHIKGLWNKSIKENKRILHVREHKSNSFDMIISSGKDLKVSVKDYSWKELGYDADGSTEALVFDSNVKKSRNEYMHDAYAKGYVDNHSVGMRYVKLELAVDDEEYEKEKDFFDKHIDGVINADVAKEQGYFWIVQEAKVVEGSAVPNGSNFVTPTLEVKDVPVELTKGEKQKIAIEKWLRG